MTGLKFLILNISEGFQCYNLGSCSTFLVINLKEKFGKFTAVKRSRKSKLKGGVGSTLSSSPVCGEYIAEK